jgi:DNA polymerase-3 subunit beta
LKITTENFRAAFAFASRAVASNTPLDILKNVRCKAGGGSFTLTGHNLTTYAEARGECGPGDLEFCVRADRIESALAVVGEEIDLSLKGALLTWKSGKSRYQMAALPVADFPEVKRDNDPLVTLEAPDIVEGLQRVVWACAIRSGRAYLEGALIDCAKQGAVRLAATDGSKMAVLLMGVEAGADAQVIVPREVINALPDGAERARIFYTSVEFDYPNGLIVARVIDGKFPDYQRVMAPKTNGTITVDRRALIHAIKAALPFDEVGAIHFILKDGAVRIESADKGGERAEIDVEGGGEGEADAWFYSPAITPALTAARGDSLVLALGAGSNDAAAFDDGALRCVCMPMRR